MQSQLIEGTRIYYGGDMANEPAFGVITKAWSDKSGNHLSVTYDDGRQTRLSPALFSDKYLGHGGTRFVTEKAFKEYRAEMMALMFKKK